MSPTEFWEHVEKTEACWRWTGATSHKYGNVRLDGVTQSAHRVSWTLTYGPIPPGVLALHKCDNPICVRPDHLFLGTQGDNVRDCQRKGRHVFGERQPFAKLTRAAVLEIRRCGALGEPKKALARRFGVDPVTIRNVIQRRRWVDA